jgi:fructosamine-3-kinase
VTDGASIDVVVRRLIGGPVIRTTPLAGGCIHDVRRLEFEDGSSCVAKVASGTDDPLLRAESVGLASLASVGLVRVPEVLGLESESGATVLLLEWLEAGSSSDASWRSFGESLARLHAHVGEDRFGFDSDNFIGRTPQRNRWCDDWVEFNATHRLQPQIVQARDAGLLTEGDRIRLDGVVDRLDRYIPRHPHPSMLHGDLWSGNVVPMVDGGVAMIDPACHWGDAWSDVAMMMLFGGFSADCFEAWEACQTDREQSRDRIAITQLYHLLNHLNLFGASYHGQAMAIADRLG